LAKGARRIAVRRTAPHLEPEEERAVFRPRHAFESADTVNRVVALLVRFPELHSLRSNPADATLTLTYAVDRRLETAAVRALAEHVSEHVRSFHALGGEEIERIAVTCDQDVDVTFVNVTRDLATFSPEELELQVAIFVERFGEALLTNPHAEESVDDETGTSEESVELALDALRDPAQRQRLVGVREEKRVLVYFVHPAKRAKVRARS
jgi:hypothetical protein